MQTLRIIVTGQVQGVGFRYFTQRTAKDLGVFGVVRNCIDGSVEIYAQGDVDVLERFHAAIRRGPRFSRVTRTVRTWNESDEIYSSFTIC